MNTTLRTSGWLCAGLSLSCLLVACNSGVVVGVEDSGLGGAGASDYSQRAQPESWCWFIDDREWGMGDSVLYEVDMTSGSWGARHYLAPHPPGPAFTIALHGRELIWDTEWSMASFNLDSGVLQTPQLGTKAITSNGEELLAFCPGSSDELCGYDSLDALWSLTASRTLPAPADTSAFALGQDALYGAQEESNTVEAYDKTSGDYLSTIELEGLELSWVSGLAVVGDRLLRIDQPFVGNLGIRISIHDVATGKRTGKVNLGNGPNIIVPKGLICGGTFD